MSKLRIAFTQAWFPMTMGMYFLRALERREDVELWTAGPYTGNWIPWNGGMTVPDKYVHPPVMQLPARLFNYQPSADILDMPWTPDLFLMLDAGFSFSTRPDAEVVARVQTDPHVLKPYYMQNKLIMDYDFCMQSNYMNAGEHFLPYAYDPTVYYPMDIPIEYDCCLIGLHYTHRDQLVNRLTSRGVSVHYSIGEIFDENREAYNKAKIALSWSSLADTPSRCWEGMAMKRALVCNRTPDMQKFFLEGQDYFGFSTLDEAQHQVNYLLSNPDELQRIAENGYHAVHAHTWDRRVQTLLDVCGLV